MRYDGDYAEAGEDYYQQRDQRNHEYLVRHHQQALTRLGYQVTIIPPGDGRPEAGARFDLLLLAGELTCQDAAPFGRARQPVQDLLGRQVGQWARQVEVEGGGGP